MTHEEMVENLKAKINAELDKHGLIATRWEIPMPAAERELLFELGPALRCVVSYEDPPRGRIYGRGARWHPAPFDDFISYAADEIFRYTNEVLTSTLKHLSTIAVPVDAKTIELVCAMRDRAKQLVSRRANAKPSVYERDGKWYWADEIWDEHGPCPDEHSARTRQNLYVAMYLERTDTRTVVSAEEWKPTSAPPGRCDNRCPWDCSCNGHCICHYQEYQPDPAPVLPA